MNILPLVGMSLLLVLEVQGASAVKIQDPASPELVLSEETQLNVTSPAGSLTIIAGKGMARQYRWEGCVVNANMVPRRSRWLGDFGMYDPVGGRGSLPASQNQACPEQIHMPVSEGQMHFDDVQLAEEWLRRHQTRSTVWSNDGLVVSFTASRSRGQGTPVRGLSAQVTLICINGRRPGSLAGATDEAIKSIPLGGVHATIRGCAQPDKDVIAETRRTLKEQWAKDDGRRRSAK
jgi:hypothetical protein